jgi:NMD protein affecting ribosome stability and mRNA decay
MLQIGTSNNPIGVYGPSVKSVADKVNNGMAPKDLFDEVHDESNSALCKICLFCGTRGRWVGDVEEQRAESREQRAKSREQRTAIDDSICYTP